MLRREQFPNNTAAALTSETVSVSPILFTTFLIRSTWEASESQISPMDTGQEKYRGDMV